LDDLLQQLAAAKEIGCETFVMDAGWYGAGAGGWTGQVGDWRENPNRAFFGNMKDFADRVRAAGLDFGLWFEPENFGPDVPVVREHPDWFIPSAFRHFRIDLSQEAPRKYMRSEFSSLIEKYDLKYIKFDFNLELGVDQSGHELYDYFSHWFKFLDYLRDKYPKIFFENCSSGAMRLDLSSHFHYDSHFPSDTGNPMDVIRISQGTLLRALPGRLLHWAVMKAIDSSAGGDVKMPTLVTPLAATWGSYESASADFVMTACSLGTLGLSGDIASLSAQDKQRIAWYIDFYKQYRCDIITASGHLLTPIRPITQRDGWIAFQLCSRQRVLSLIYVFHLTNDGQSITRLKLFELEMNSEYKISRLDPDGVFSILTSGEELKEQGLEVSIPCAQHGYYAAAIYTVEKQGKR
jgi:alpha-galactosidase